MKLLWNSIVVAIECSASSSLNSWNIAQGNVFVIKLENDTEKHNFAFNKPRQQVVAIYILINICPWVTAFDKTNRCKVNQQ